MTSSSLHFSMMKVSSWLLLLLFVFGSTLRVTVAQTTTTPITTTTNDVEQRVDSLLSQMSTRDKIGQMIMDIENAYELPINIGAYMIGASDPPLTATGASNTPNVWRQRINALNDISKHPTLNIPVMFGTDAVHGHNVVSGGTIFPHNIGLGATRNANLVQQMAQITAQEIHATGLDLTFAPTIAVARTMTWGRTYEAFSENTELVSELGAAYIAGLQSTEAGNKIATAKHWIGDGGTTDGIDAGDTALDNDTLFTIHGQPYVEAIAQNVGAIMVSFSSVQGVSMHSHTYWITEVLKNQLGFQGFVLSDWEGYLRNPGDFYSQQVQIAVNAGIDMLMCPYQGYIAMESIFNGTQTGDIPLERIDDAARRVLRTKLKHGIMERPVWDTTTENIPQIGTPANRAVARQAVRESLVLLKNDNQALPLSKSSRLLVTGKSAHNMQLQCGGWTMSWQGNSNETRHAIVGGTTILEGFQQYHQGTVTHSPTGDDADASQHDVAVVVVGEFPYAEFHGDRTELYLDEYDLQVLQNVQNAAIETIILVIVSGRPLLITDEIDTVDAVVAAWLPGTEGDGVAEVLYGENGYDFTGKLPFSWPLNMNQIYQGFIGGNPNVLFEFGYGLDMASTSTPMITTTDAPTASTSVQASIAPTGAAPVATPVASPVSAPVAATNSPTIFSPVASPTAAPISATSNDPSPTTTDSVPSATLANANIPGRPYLLAATSKTITIGWPLPESTTTTIKTADGDVVGDLQYEVFMDNVSAGIVQSPPFQVQGLEPETSYTFTVRSVHNVGGSTGNNSNKSNLSLPLIAGTAIIVDDFGDGDDVALDDWGYWRFSHGGVAGDGNTEIHLDVQGFSHSNDTDDKNNTAVQLIYAVDSGTSGYANLFLDFADGEAINLLSRGILAVQFQMQGQDGTSFRVHWGTPLASPFAPVFYKSPPLKPKEDEWTLVTLMLTKNFTTPTNTVVDYTLNEALQQTTALVFENDIPGQWGWFIIDDVEFLTSQSLPLEVIVPVNNNDKDKETNKDDVLSNTGGAGGGSNNLTETGFDRATAGAMGSRSVDIVSALVAVAVTATFLLVRN